MRINKTLILIHTPPNYFGGDFIVVGIRWSNPLHLNYVLALDLFNALFILLLVTNFRVLYVRASP